MFMEQFERAKIIMLSHNNINTTITKYLPNTLSLNNDLLQPHTNQHLYIISDDEIKKDDWILFSYKRDEGMIFKFIEKDKFGSSKLYNPITKKEEWFDDMFVYKKIIATTDTSLNISEYAPQLWKYLPQPSQQFIEKYIESYNKGEVITDVLVEYISVIPQSNGLRNDGKIIDEIGFGDINTLFVPKLNYKDNTITIKKLKISWNRKEVIELLKQLENNIENSMDSDDDGNTFNNFDLNKWVEENL